MSQVKNSSKIYFLLTSIAMMFPPLVLGLSYIYFNRYDHQIAWIGIIMNYVLILIISLIGFLLYQTSKISVPSIQDIRMLIFGFLSNIIIYLFVFQNELKIAGIIDIYISTILILVMYFVLVNRKYINLELTILSILFFLFYRFHLFFVFRDFYQQPTIIGVPVLLRIVYVLVPLVAIFVYIYKVISYKIIDWFTGIFTILAVLSTIILMFIDKNLSSDLGKFLGTIYLIMPFIFLIDLIVTKFAENKLKLPFYLRMIILMIMIAIFKFTEFFTVYSYADEQMYQFTFIMYASIFLNIIEHFVSSRKKDVKVKDEILEAMNFKLITDGLVKVGTNVEIVSNNNMSQWIVVDVREENMVLRNVDSPSEVQIVEAKEFEVGYFIKNKVKHLIKKI